MTAVNAHEGLARERKAVAIADMLDAFAIHPDSARDLPIGSRLDVATAAGQRTPSETTWTRACDLLAQRLTIRAALPADPFEGLS